MVKNWLQMKIIISIFQTQNYQLYKNKEMSFMVHRISNMSIQPLQRASDHGPSSISLNEFMRTKTQLFNLKQKPIKNCKKQSLYQCKLNWINLVLFVINFMSVLLAIVGNFNVTKQENQIQCRYLLILSVISVIVNLTRIIAQSQLISQIESKQFENSNNSKYSSLFKKAIFQTIFLSIHPNEIFINSQIQLFPEQPLLKVNSILTLIVYLRIFMIIKFFLMISRYYGLRINRILSLYRGNSTEFQLLYSIKCFLKQNGLRSPFMLYGLWILIIPFVMLAVNPELSQQSYSYLNSVYDILITMTTIGFGEIHHNFTIIRIVIIMVIILGSLSTSFFTLSFIKWFTLSQQEQKAFRFIKRLTLKEEIQKGKSKNTKQLIKTLLMTKKNKFINDNTKSTEQNAYVNKKRPTLQMQSQQLEIDKKPKNFIKSIKDIKIFPQFEQLPEMQLHDVSSLQSELRNQSENFFDYFQKTNLQFVGSLQLLIEKSLLTSNLLQFFLMRHEHNFTKTNGFDNKSLCVDSSQTIKSRKRVDDNMRMYQLKLNIINNNKNNKTKLLVSDIENKQQQKNKSYNNGNDLSQDTQSVKKTQKDEQKQNEHSTQHQQSSTIKLLGEEHIQKVRTHRRRVRI